MQIFQASLPVLALILAFACILAAVVGKKTVIGPIAIPDLNRWQRTWIGFVGVVLLMIPLWPSVANGQSFVSAASGVYHYFFPKEYQEAYTDLETAIDKGESSATIIDLARDVYDDYRSPEQRCRVMDMLSDHYQTPQQRIYIPNDIRSDVIGYHDGTSATRPLHICAGVITVLISVVLPGGSRLATTTAPDRTTPQPTSTPPPYDWHRHYVEPKLRISITATPPTPTPAVTETSSPAVGSAVVGSATVAEATPMDPCAGLPPRSATVLSGCGQTYAVPFGGSEVTIYSESDKHDVTIHFRNVGSSPLSLEVLPGCAGCKRVSGVILGPGPGGETSHDYCYRHALPPFRFGWILAATVPSGAAKEARC